MSFTGARAQGRRGGRRGKPFSRYRGKNIDALQVLNRKTAMQPARVVWGSGCPLGGKCRRFVDGPEETQSWEQKNLAWRGRRGVGICFCGLAKAWRAQAGECSTAQRRVMIGRMRVTPHFAPGSGLVGWLACEYSAALWPVLAPEPRFYRRYGLLNPLPTAGPKFSLL